MREKKLVQIGKWLNKKGYDLNLKDDFWMEDYLEEHKIRDLAELLNDYYNEQLILTVVSRRKPKNTKIVLGFNPTNNYVNEYYKQFKKAQDELRDLNQTTEDKTLS